MKKLTVVLLLGVFMITSVPAFAQKGASDQAKEHASDQAIFNRVGDWFSTIGKSGVQKDKILVERKAKRAAKRAEKAAMKAKKKAGKKVKAAGDDAGKKAGKMKKKMKGSKKGFKKGS